MCISKKHKNNQIRRALQNWQNYVREQRITEVAFAQISELNQRHQFQRFQAALYLMQKTIRKFEEQLKRDSLHSIARILVNFKNQNLTETLGATHISHVSGSQTNYSKYPLSDLHNQPPQSSHLQQSPLPSPLTTNTLNNSLLIQDLQISTSMNRYLQSTFNNNNIGTKTPKSHQDQSPQNKISISSLMGGPISRTPQQSHQQKTQSHILQTANIMTPIIDKQIQKSEHF